MQSKQINNIKKVGILRGGAGKHYIRSLKKGGEIIAHIFENLGEKYKIFDILIDQDHIWHFNGIPINPSDLINRIDAVWNVSHPSFSNILDSLSIPNIGVSSFAHTLENSKEILREHIKKIDVQMPRSVVLPLYQKDLDGAIDKYSIKKAKDVFEKFSSPWLVRSFTENSSVSIFLAKTFPELVNVIKDLSAQACGVKNEASILVEEFIAGKVASLYSAPMFRGEEIYVFPLTPVTQKARPQEVFSFSEKELLTKIAKDLHKHIGAKHFLKSDFVLNSRGKVYLLQINGVPNLKPDSHFSEVCESVGAKMHHVVEHILEQMLLNARRI